MIAEGERGWVAVTVFSRTACIPSAKQAEQAHGPRHRLVPSVLQIFSPSASAGFSAVAYV